MRGSRTVRWALTLAVALAAVAPALAADPSPAKPSGVNSTSPPPAKGKSTAETEAAAINARNPMVVHAGPGKPQVGSAHAPPAPGKK